MSGRSISSSLHLRPSVIDLYAARVAALFGVTLDDIKGGRRHTKIVDARHALAWALRHGAGASYLDIGRALNRDHTSIIYACRRVDALRAASDESRQILDALIDREVAA